jgi:hypothetical protein
MFTTRQGLADFFNMWKKAAQVRLFALSKRTTELYLHREDLARDLLFLFSLLNLFYKVFLDEN